ncbi:CAP-Gly domain-containing linker protein 4-like isoform X2 [Tachypleus tridentatus]|uniref:CAP-Gly domain-containing linker protein 4-like isoform X2 n=1 Tax=Tachypleus tridentatus TaxID=6853 RepID=UPI003FD5245B
MTHAHTEELTPNQRKEESSVTQRDYPVIHPASDSPLCKTCQQLNLPFFDPSCPGCLEFLRGELTSIAEIFAIIRQWVPQTQQNIDLFVNEILKRGAHINDRDGLTDMTLLHYACKAGATGVGDVQVAIRTTALLLDKGADVSLRCRWTDMGPVHYAAYFDVAPVLELLLKFTENRDCVPDFPNRETIPDLCDVVNSLRQLLQKAVCFSQSLPPNATHDYSCVAGKAVLQSVGVNIGDKVIVGGAKVGILRFCGATHFAPGIWVGIELDEPLGKNNGTVKEVSYFSCPDNHGIFAPVGRVKKYEENSFKQLNKTSSNPTPKKSVTFPKIDVTHVTSKIETGLGGKDFAVGDKVMVGGKRKGIIRFAGETEFAPGWWYGIELDQPLGKNDGSVQGVKYFECHPDHGLFASSQKITRISKSESESSDVDSFTEPKCQSFVRSLTDDSNSSFSSPRSVRTNKKNPRSSKTRSLESSSFKLQKGCWLTVGMNVFVHNELGVVRYIGPVEFADGTWLGIELRTPRGKNDGSVQGYRYFTCKTNYGLIVRPNRVTVRGINGSKLIGEDL